MNDQGNFFESLGLGDDDPGRAVLRFRLEMEPEEFLPLQETFLRDLAQAAGVPQERLDVIAVRPGCTDVFLAVEGSDGDPRAIVVLLTALAPEGSPDELASEFRAKYRVTSITEIRRFVPPYLASFLQEHAALTEEGERVTWLHLSDLHAKSGDTAVFQDQVSRRFVDELPGLLDNWGLVPDLLFFTGDLAFSGRRDEYKSASAFLGAVVEALPAPVRVFVIPGNHDVTWDAIDQRFDDRLDQELVDHARVSQFLMGTGDFTTARRETARLRLANYSAFVDGLGAFDHPGMQPSGYYYSDVVNVNSVSVGVGGFNSAWRSTSRPPKSRRSDHQRLLLGAAQIDEISNQVKNTDIRIALCHHPPDSDWFRSFDRNAHRSNMGEFDFLLHGHEHAAGALGVRHLSGRSDRLQIAGGALYTPEIDHPNSFNVVTVNLTSGKGVGFFWRYLDDSFRWGPDDGVADRGRTFFELPTPTVERIARRQLADDRNAATTTGTAFDP